MTYTKCPRCEHQSLRTESNNTIRRTHEADTIKAIIEFYIEWNCDHCDWSGDSDECNVVHIPPLDKPNA